VIEEPCCQRERVFGNVFESPAMLVGKLRRPCCSCYLVSIGTWGSAFFAIVVPTHGLYDRVYLFPW